MIFQGAKTSFGLPGFWEKRAHSQFLTQVEMICDQNFGPKKGIFLNRTDNIAKSFHVIFVPKQGDIICQIIRNNKRNNNMTITLYVVTQLLQDETTGRFSIETMEVAKGSTISEIIKEVGIESETFLKSCLYKLDNDEIMSCYTQAMNIPEERINTEKQ